MFKNKLKSYLFLCILMLNPTLFCAQPELTPEEQSMILNNKETPLAQQIKNHAKKHGKKITACLVALGGAYICYKFLNTTKTTDSSSTNNEENANNSVQTNKTNHKRMHPAQNNSPTTTTPKNQLQPEVNELPVIQLTDKTNLELVQADITKLAFTPGKKAAIVNAANTELWAGGGVCGAIFKASGPKYVVMDENGKPLLDAKGNPTKRWKLEDECLAIPKKDGVYCPVGQARYTPGGDTFAQKNIAVIHAVGPHGDTPNREQLLTGAYYNSLIIAEEHEILEIAFPAISTNIFGYDSKDANPVAIQAVAKYFKEHPKSKIEKVIFVSYDAKDVTQYKKDFDQYK